MVIPRVRLGLARACGAAVLLAPGLGPATGAGAAATDDARAICSRIESAIGRVTSYDLRYKVRSCRDGVEGAIPAGEPFPSPECQQPLDEHFEDTYSSRLGRRIRWINARGEAHYEAIRRFDDEGSRGHSVILERLGAGHDYLFYLHPKIGTRDIFAALKEHPGLRTRETPDRPGRLAVEIPAEALAELDEMGCRVWADRARGLVPVRVDTYVAVDGREVLVSRMDIEPAEVSPDVWAPVGGTYAALRHLPDAGGARSTYETVKMEVGRPSSKWNPSLSADGLAGHGGQVQKGGLDGWTEQARTPTRARPSSERRVVLLVNVAIIFCAIVVGMYRKWTASRLSGGDRGDAR